jgi:two-component system chemotaxis sensor kinase CheA
LNNNRWGLQTKIFMGYLLIILCLIISIAVVHSRISSLQNEINTITQHDRDIANLTNQIETNVLDMETGQRGFVITGNTLYLEPYARGKLQWESSYDLLYVRVSDNPVQARRLESIRKNIENWIFTNGDPIIALKRGNREQDIAQSFNEGISIKQIDNIRLQVAAFRNLENELSSARISEQAQNNKQLIVFLYTFGFLFIALSVGTSLVTSKTIVRTIREVTTAIREIATSEGGDIGKRIHIRTQDEVGDLGSVTNLLLDNHQYQNWILNQSGDMTIMYQGITNSAELADRFLTKISAWVTFQFGALYFRSKQADSDLFVKMASYAGEASRIGKKSFLLGDGLVGQCAKEKKIIDLDQVPEGYLKIDSALGQSSPRFIYIAPVEFQGKVVAVLELASLAPFSTKERKLLTYVLESFGAAIQSVLNSSEIEKLYSESQQLNEELQVHSEEFQTQSEELQVINEQLEEQNRYAQLKSDEAENSRAEMEQYALQAKSSSQFKSQFLANMSHELRNPLNSMLVFSQFLEENSNGNLTEEELMYVQYIHSGGLDLLKLINDILDLSKVEAGIINLELEPVNLTELPQTMDQHFKSLAEKKQLDFSVVLQPGLPDVMVTDENRLQQILKNLVSNAIKFTKEGKVELSIQKIHVCSDVQAYEDIERLEAISFAVKDTGIGIAANHLGIIFEAFHQADGTIERQYGGTGLGLSISRQLAEILGGNLTVQSKEGEGSTFTLTLPLHGEPLDIQAVLSSEGLPMATVEPSEARIAESNQLALYPESTSYASLFEGKRVLIVDDDERNLIALTQPLKHKGMEIVTAQSGQLAIELLQSHSIDIVLMDIMMPGMNGNETIKIIRGTLNRPDLPIIAVTARAMNLDRLDSLEAGASAYISKPLNLDQLFSIMRVWLSTS